MPVKDRLTRLAVTSVALADYLGLPSSLGPGPLDLRAIRQESKRRVTRLGDYFVRAWQGGADFVAGYESITGAGGYGFAPETRHVIEALIEPVPGPTTEFFGRLAKKHHAWCAICLEESEGARVYNTAVLIDRRGRVAGKYRKVHLPAAERLYATPGDGFPVFETDFGRVGFSICYDLFFPEAARAVALNGADLLVHIGNTAYTCREETLAVRAAENMFWVLACNVATMISAIVDPTGTHVARATAHTGDVVFADVALQRERELPMDNLFVGTKSLRGRLLQERMPDAYRVLTAARPPLLERYRDDRLPRTARERRRVFEANREAIRKLLG
jgi:predicted amidohydrolase